MTTSNPFEASFASDETNFENSTPAFDFPTFESAVPEIVRHNAPGRSASHHPDPKVQAFLDFLASAIPGQHAKVVGATKTGNPDIDATTEKLASKIALAANKRGYKVTRRTVTHPSDAAKPENERRKVIAFWRAS